MVSSSHSPTGLWVPHREGEETSSQTDMNGDSIKSLSDLTAGTDVNRRVQEDMRTVNSHFRYIVEYSVAMQMTPPFIHHQYSSVGPRPSQFFMECFFSPSGARFLCFIPKQNFTANNLFTGYTYNFGQLKRE